jgi:hypothetical protein
MHTGKLIARSEWPLQGDHFNTYNARFWPGAANCPKRAEWRDIGRPRLSARPQMSASFNGSFGFRNIFPEAPPF